MCNDKGCKKLGRRAIWGRNFFVSNEVRIISFKVLLAFNLTQRWTLKASGNR